ncbi:MAG: hypothetical protein WBB32_00065 [Flavobacteriales bacterium]
MSATEEEHGKLYWLQYNLRKGAARRIEGFLKRRPVVAIVTLVTTFLLIFIWRSLWHPFVLTFRKYAFWIFVLLVLVWLLGKVFRGKHRWIQALGSLASVLGLVALIYIGPLLIGFVSQYVQYHRLNKVEVDELPITGHERVQPISSIHTLTDQEALSETEDATSPRFIRDSDGTYAYTTAIGPSKQYRVQQFLKDMSEVITIPGSAPSPDFSSKYRSKVDFDIGENLLFSKNTHTAALKHMSLWQYCTMEPAEAVYLRNDAGEWVQVVSLIKWVGVAFPRPVFGGVNVIEQRKPSDNWIKRMLFGRGTFIPAGDIKDHPYLVGQDLMPHEVSRYIAECFRFRRGFTAPLPGYHEGDIRIPKLPEGQDPQPFVLYTTLGDGPGKLFNYYGLEPFEEAKKGLSVSLFIPGDDMQQVYVIDHTRQGDAYVGSSAVSAKIVESKKMYDWTHSYPAETRPYIRQMDNANRLFWLSTIVTRAGDGDGRFIGGSIPEVTITDAVTGKVTWIPEDAIGRPDEWMPIVEESLGRHLGR